jgi:transposase
MGGFVTGSDRRQRILFPDLLDDYVPEESSVRFIDAFVDGLDLAAMGFTHAEPEDTGRPPYDPADLLKLYLYGYLNSVRSSRKLERECGRNVEVIWLMRKLAPDFKTIADFRRDNVDQIRPVFRELLALCKRLKLMDTDLVAIDGSKFRAVNSRQRHFTRKTLKEQLESIDERIARYLRELDENDAKEASEERLALRVAGLKEKIAALRDQQGRGRLLLSQMEAMGRTEVSLTDPDCRMMKNNGRVEPCYNTQIAVEPRNKLVVEYDVNDQPSDDKQLVPMARRARETLGVVRLKATADKGYYNGDQISKCKENGIVPYIPEIQHRSGAAKRTGIPPEFDRDKFVYDSSSDAIICPAGQRLTPGGPWLQLRWRKGLGVSRGRIYRTKQCFSCPHFMSSCTHNPKGRHIVRTEYDDVMDLMRARVKTEEGRRILGLRRALAEHPFGTIKRGLNQGYLLLKGLRKVGGEMGLTMTAYNMRRALSIVGTRRLLAALAS